METVKRLPDGTKHFSGLGPSQVAPGLETLSDISGKGTGVTGVGLKKGAGPEGWAAAQAFSPQVS